MNYLEKNLHKSKLLPYDVMKIIYEYADPFNKIRKQIQNKEYDLEEIMYQRMKKYILHLSTGRPFFSYMVSDENRYVFLDKNNIDDRAYYDLVLYGNSGYKEFFLKPKIPPRICGLYVINYRRCYRQEMINDLKIVKPDVRYKHRSTKQIYQLWKKL